MSFVLRGQPGKGSDHGGIEGPLRARVATTHTVGDRDGPLRNLEVSPL